MMSNGIPTDDNSDPTDNAISTTAGEFNNYDANMNNSAAATDFRFLAWHNSAVGTVTCKEPAVEVTRWPNRLGSQITVSQAMGHNLLRPEGTFAAYLGS